MSALLDSIKQKYSEEVGWSFSFFEGITFFLYLTASWEVLCNSGPGIWNGILEKSAYSIVIGEASVLATARIIDYLIAAVLTGATVYGFRYVSSRIYDYLCTLKDLDDYVERLKSKYVKSNLEGQAMRIYIANEAKEQKQIYMKQVTAINGFGLVALGVMVSAIIGLATPNATDFVMMSVGAVLVLLLQWQSFSRYASQVVPRLILERLARGREVQFGDEYQV